MANDLLEQDIESFWGEFEGLFSVLMSDATHHRALATSPRTSVSQRNRRAFCRALFACVEGTVHLFKQFALVMEKYGPFTYDHNERDRLSGKRPKPTQTNPSNTAPFRDPIKQALPFAFEEWARQNFHPIYKFNRKDPGWADFCLALKTRNRITHPKKTHDLQITDQEWRALNSSSEWFVKATDDMMVSTRKSLLKQARSLRRKWNKEHPKPLEATPTSSRNLDQLRGGEASALRWMRPET